MSLLVVILLSILTTSGNQSLASNGLRLIGTVEEKNENFLTLKIEEVVSLGSDIRVVPDEGDEITVRLPGQRPPEDQTRIIIDIKEKTQVGETPSAYLMTSYETIH
jgi:hypothetical protein